MVHSACTLDLPDPRLHRSQASTRGRLICIWPVWFSGFYPRCACMQTRLLSATLRYVHAEPRSNFFYTCGPNMHSWIKWNPVITGQFLLHQRRPVSTGFTVLLSCCDGTRACVCVCVCVCGRACACHTSIYPHFASAIARCGSIDNICMLFFV